MTEGRRLVAICSVRGPRLHTLEDIFMVANFMVDNLMVAKIWGFSRKIPKF